MTKYLIIISIVFTGLMSCTEVIDMQFTTDFERLVVDATIMDQDTLQYINLSKINLNAEDSIVSPISNASVIVNDGSTDFVFEESENQRGLYVGPTGFIGEHDKTYRLKIANVGVKGTDDTDVYEASATMANPLNMDSTTAEYVYRPQFGMDGFVLKCWAKDPPERNYYLFKAWKNDTIITDTLYEYNQTDDLIFNGNKILGVDCQMLSDDKPEEFVNDGDSLSLEIDNIDKAYYDFLNSAQSENRGTNPLFGGPPANVTTNVSNGAVGIFRVFSVDKKSVYVEVADRSMNPAYQTK